jgi:uncharacterized DUF497 family protein
LLDFEWDSENVGHIARHGVSVAEVEYVLEHPTLEREYQDWSGEERFVEVGATPRGRIVVVVTTWRGLKTRVVTAFDADAGLSEEYLRSR